MLSVYIKHNKFIVMIINSDQPFMNILGSRYLCMSSENSPSLGTLWISMAACPNSGFYNLKLTRSNLISILQWIRIILERMLWCVLNLIIYIYAYLTSNITFLSPASNLSLTGQRIFAKIFFLACLDPH